MITYEVRITDYALNQMQETVNYISFQLASPTVARKWLDEMKKRIASLSQMPKRIKLVNEEPWHSEGIRKMIVSNYFVYFFVDDTLSVVWVTAVVYSGMEQDSQLKKIK